LCCGNALTGVDLNMDSNPLDQNECPECWKAGSRIELIEDQSSPERDYCLNTDDVTVYAQLMCPTCKYQRRGSLISTTRHEDPNGLLNKLWTAVGSFCLLGLVGILLLIVILFVGGTFR
jgi:hypothetical protein